MATPWRMARGVECVSHSTRLNWSLAVERAAVAADRQRGREQSAAEARQTTVSRRTDARHPSRLHRTHARLCPCPPFPCLADRLSVVCCASACVLFLSASVPLPTAFQKSG